MNSYFNVKNEVIVKPFITFLIIQGLLKVKVMRCKICKKEIVGRSDKIFCSMVCKNYYHTQLRKVTNKACLRIDEILHRNRSILLEIMGKNGVQKKIPKELLVKKNFKFGYMTHFYVNKQQKMYHYVYDFGWMDFSTNEVLIIRLRKE